TVFFPAVQTPVSSSAQTSLEGISPLLCKRVPESRVCVKESIALKKKLLPTRLAISCLSLIGALAVVFSASAAHTSHSSKPTFGGAVTLMNGKSAAAGGEPSIATDVYTKVGKNDLYVVSPNEHALWYSYDRGKKWSQPVVFDQNGTSPGGDS